MELSEQFDPEQCRRRTGVGRLESDAYLESLRAMFELSSDVRIEPIYEVQVTPEASLSANHWFGTNAEGGEFEAVYEALIQVDGERIVGLELFELDDLEKSRVWKRRARIGRALRRTRRHSVRVVGERRL
jgi:hypothetical protein